MLFSVYVNRFELESDINWDRMKRSIDMMEWTSDMIEYKWIYKFNTSILKLMSEWQNSLRVWMREYMKLYSVDG